MPLTLNVGSKEFWDETSEVFITVEPRTLVLEHSLISISKWEQRHHKPFLHGDKTNEELLDYIRCMVIGSLPDALHLDVTELSLVQDYIADPMTATTFNDRNARQNREIVTSEVIYYWMFSYGIPKECEKWHLNSLMTLIRVFSLKNSEQKKMTTKEATMHQHQLNQARRAKHRARDL